MRTDREIGACKRASLAAVVKKLTEGHNGVKYKIMEHRHLLLAWGWSEAYIQALADVEAENENG